MYTAVGGEGGGATDGACCAAGWAALGPSHTTPYNAHALPRSYQLTCNRTLKGKKKSSCSMNSRRTAAVIEAPRRSAWAQPRTWAEWPTCEMFCGSQDSCPLYPPYDTHRGLLLRLQGAQHGDCGHNDKRFGPAQIPAHVPRGLSLPRRRGLWHFFVWAPRLIAMQEYPISKEGFEVLNRLGSGSFGNVTKVIHRETGALMARKVWVYSSISVLGNVNFLAIQPLCWASWCLTSRFV